MLRNVGIRERRDYASVFRDVGSRRNYEYKLKFIQFYKRQQLIKRECIVFNEQYRFVIYLNLKHTIFGRVWFKYNLSLNYGDTVCTTRHLDCFQFVHN